MKRKNHRFDVVYKPHRGRRQVIRVGFRELEALEAIQHRPASRLDLIKTRNARIALNLPSTVAGLTRKGFSIDKKRVDSQYRHGRGTWWKTYHLSGSLVNVTPVARRAAR